MFQFPSNGKAYLKLGMIEMHQRKNRKRVSIPFKRESISKEEEDKGKPFKLKVSIPFKRESISKETEMRTYERIKSLRFNSLQTGKHI